MWWEETDAASILLSLKLLYIHHTENTHHMTIGIHSLSMAVYWWAVKITDVAVALYDIVSRSLI